jgi:hypothetical protein
MPDFKSNTFTSGYIESTASSKRHTKEDIKLDHAIPEDILALTGKFEDLLEAYYEYMNMEEYVYDSTETYEDVILDGKVRFRILDPDNENNKFFIWDSVDGNIEAELNVYETDGDQHYYGPINMSHEWYRHNVELSNGYDIPNSISILGYDVGQTWESEVTTAFNGYIAKLTTTTKNVVRNGPSNVLNTIDEAMDIDENSSDYLTMMQKELAPIIPQNSYVDKRDLLKKIIDFYLIRGTEDSIKTFFRIFYSEDVQVSYPWDVTLKPSDGTWITDSPADPLAKYIDNKGMLSNLTKLQDSDYYQRFSYVVKSARNTADWNLAFERLVHPAGMKFFGEVMLFIDAIAAVEGDLVPATDPTWAHRSGVRHSSLTSKMPGGQIGYQGLYFAKLVEALVSFDAMTAATYLTLTLYNPSISENNLYNRTHLGILDIDSSLYPTPIQLGLDRAIRAYGNNTINTITTDIKIGNNSTVISRTIGVLSIPADAILAENGTELTLEDGTTLIFE